MQGAIYSYENTFNEKTVEWHPHIHMFALVDQWIDQQKFSEYWHSITGDSMVLDVRRVKKKKDTAIAKRLPKSVSTLLSSVICPLKKTWEAFKVLKGKRLTRFFWPVMGVSKFLKT